MGKCYWPKLAMNIKHFYTSGYVSCLENEITRLTNSSNWHCKVLLYIALTLLAHDLLLVEIKKNRGKNIWNRWKQWFTRLDSHYDSSFTDCLWHWINMWNQLTSANGAAHIMKAKGNGWTLNNGSTLPRMLLCFSVSYKRSLGHYSEVLKCS